MILFVTMYKDEKNASKNDDRANEKLKAQNVATNWITVELVDDLDWTSAEY